MKKKNGNLKTILSFCILLWLDHYLHYFYDKALMLFDIKTNAGNFPGAREVQCVLKAALAVSWCEWKLVGVERVFPEHQLCAL